MTALIIANTQIRRDAANRYCLNDLHQASGGEARHKPGNWMMLAKTSELVSELKSQQGGAGNPAGPPEEEFVPVSIVNTGVGNGTYAVKELVYAYAMWINAAFHLHVIRAYDALVTGQAADTIPPLLAGPQHRADQLVSAGRAFAALVRAGRTLRMGHARSLSSANAATYRATGIDLVAELDAADMLTDTGPALLGTLTDSWIHAETVADWLADRAEVTAGEIIVGALDKDPNDRALQTRLGHVMKSLGWNKVRRRGEGSQYYYVRPGWSGWSAKPE